MNQVYLRAAAESYARINAVQAACYHYSDSQSELQRQILTDHYTGILTAQNTKPKYISAIVCAALTELTYPTRTTDNYAWSGNQRAAFANIAKATWSRNQLCKYVELIIDDIRANAITVSIAINEQLHS